MIESIGMAAGGRSVWCPKGIADSLRGRCPLKNPRGLFSLYDFAGAKSRVRPGA